MKCRTWIWGIGLALAPLASLSAAPSSCSQPPAIMAAWGSTVSLSSSRSADASSELRMGQAMSVRLHPKRQVHFAATDAGYRDGRGYAGTLRLKVDEAGTYRFDLDSNARIDVASNGRMADSSDEGLIRGCSTIRKYVEFRLAKGEFVLQLSSDKSHSVKVLAMRVD